MAQQTIGIGSAPNDGTGDPLRTAWGKVNANFTELYVGVATIVTVGTITTGVWQGTAIAIGFGGTGGATAAAARTNLGLAIGTNVQAWDADLDAFAALTPSNDDFAQRKAGAWTNRTVAQVLTDLQGDGSSASSGGYRGIPQSIKSANYTTVLADNGIEIFHPSSDNNARTMTIDDTLSYPIGAVIAFGNDAAASTTIAINNSATLRLIPAGTTGSRTLAQYGECYAKKKAAGIWWISGSNLT